LLRQSYTGADEQRSTGQDYQLFPHQTMSCFCPVPPLHPA
jgi:hypothetical protein